MDGEMLSLRREFPVAVVFALVWGALLMAMLNIPVRFAAAMGAGVLILASAAFVENKRVYVLSFLTLSLFLGSSKTVFSAATIWPGFVERLTLDLSDVFMLIGCALHFASPGPERRTNDGANPVLLPALALYLGASCLSFLNSEYLFMGTFELARLAKAGVLFWFVSNNVRSLGEARWLVWLLALGVFLELGVVLTQKYAGGTLGMSYFGETQTKVESFVDGSRVFRAGGTMGHPNRLAYCFDLVIPLMLTMAFSAALRTGQRLFYYLAFAASCACLGLTLSRGGVVASALALAACFACLAYRGLRTGTGLPAIALTLLLGLSLLPLGQPLYERFSKRDSGAFQTRVDQNRVARNIIAEHPLIGVGLNAYRNAAPLYDDTAAKISAAFPYPVHNSYLLAFAETGLFGFIPFCALLFFMFRAAWFGRWAHGWRRDLHAGVFFGLAAFAVHAFVDMVPLASFPLLFFLLGLAAAVGRLGLGRDHAEAA